MTGYTLLALKRWSEAAEALRQALDAEFKPLDDALRDEVRRYLGKALTRSDKFDEALAVLEPIREVHPSGEVLQLIGQCLLAKQQWLEAAEAFEAALQAELEPLSDAAKKQLEPQLDRALGHTATVALRSKLADATVRIDDGEPLELPTEVRLLEGEHVLLVSAPGHLDESVKLTLSGGQARELDVAPKPIKADEPSKPPPAPSPRVAEPWFAHQQTIGLVAAGTGVALGVAALGTFIASASLRSSVEQSIADHDATYGRDCSRGDYGLCYASAQVINRDGEQVESLEQASLGLGITAGVLVAAGATLFLGDPTLWASEGDEPSATAAAADPSGPPVALRCGPFGPAGLGCVGAF